MRRLLAALVGLALALALGELLVRVSGADLRLLRPLLPLQVFEPAVHEALPDPELLYGLRPGLSLTLPSACPWSDAPRTIRTNSLGLRDPERPPARGGGLRIIAAGSSNTFGPCVSDGETWPAQLEAELNRRAPRGHAVWNAGVSGYMTRQAAQLALRLARAHDADLVLLQVYNVGPRFAYVDQPIGEAMASDERWAELLAYTPAPSTPAFAIFRGCALWRFAVIALNRVARTRPSWDPLPGRIERSRAADQVAFDALAAEFPTIVVVPPSGAEQPEGDGRVIDLSAEDPGFGDEGRDIHPGPRVYAAVARSIADALERFGYLDP